MKALYHIMGLMVAFCLMAVVLITSVEAVVYWNDGYFEKEYTKYHVLEEVSMEMEELLSVTDEMMAYLKGERDDLVVNTIVDGTEREFFNAKEKRHMEDVQGLFLGAVGLRRGAAVLMVLGAAALLVKKQGLVLLRMLQWGIGLFIGGMAGLSALASTDFTEYFKYFHLLFFDNMDWYLDPETDLLINIVPEGFFRDTAYRIAALFLAVSFILWLGAGLLRRKAQK
ncbi:MAG: TIGR01906 family membrane protein [Bacteroidales bacterium]|nr:TIGR01906 family membrane protein [Anaerotignum sp.]MCI5679818.1 TIGR01906 family membrane protein [Bacteroidales bacterium]MDY3925824.1 TIGR01906 family membrane protein [Anaerotignum sp.]